MEKTLIKIIFAIGLVAASWKIASAIHHVTSPSVNALLIRGKSVFLLWTEDQEDLQESAEEPVKFKSR